MLVTVHSVAMLGTVLPHDLSIVFDGVAVTESRTWSDIAGSSRCVILLHQTTSAGPEGGERPVLVLDIVSMSPSFLAHTCC